MADEISSLEILTPEAKARLEKLRSEIRYEKMTISFSIEDRDPAGRKKTNFYSVNASRGSSEAWTEREARIASCLVSKHVVRCVYRDAARRGVISSLTAMEEVKTINKSYDTVIARILNGEET